jgi:EAL domain-containing protein (putative c-di-GMP-specific phosphodiesterase class I)
MAKGVPARRGAADGVVAHLETPVEPQTLADPALVRDVQTLLEPHLPRIVNDFYARLSLDPPLLDVLQRLTPEQVEQLRLRQAEHVCLLLSPHLDPRRLHGRSREIGRAHAMLGVQTDGYVDALADLRRGLFAVLSPHGDALDLPRAQSVITDRFMSDLHGVLAGFQDLEDAQNRVLLRVLEAASDARTLSDLAHGMVNALASLDGMAVCLFARLGDDGLMEYEFGGGRGFDQFTAVALERPFAPVTATESQATGQGPIGRAWRTGKIQRCDSLGTDPSTAPWRDIAQHLGWQSSASVPLVDRRGRTRALLSLQSYGIGFFAAAGRTAMLEQTKRVTERALIDLEERPTLGARVTGYLDRATHLARLAEGRVEMLFQPQIALRDGRLTKLEALARLRGADGGLVSPAEFLPAFGDDQLFDLFEHGIHQSLDAVKRWEAAGLHTGVSVNLPVVSAEDDRYARLVSELLGTYEVAPQRLTLELLETGFVDRETEQRRRSFDDFKAIGVRLAQDDLGSGYSSLLRLRHFAFDDVKIDQSLVRGTSMTPGAALAFIKPINAIAHSLGLSVVIEGLEDPGLIEVGVQLAVDEGQGYGIARPMPVADVVDWARDFRFDVDPCVPRTATGALAGHVAWEHRLAALGTHPSREVVLDLSTCALTTYADRLGDPDITATHRALHETALADRSRAEHMAAWQQLTVLVGPAT